MAGIEFYKIGKIKPNPKNPRTIRDDKFEKLKKSIQDFSVAVQQWLHLTK